MNAASLFLLSLPSILRFFTLYYLLIIQLTSFCSLFLIIGYRKKLPHVCVTDSHSSLIQSFPQPKRLS